MENKNVKVNTEVDFRITQNDIIEMLVDDRFNQILEKTSHFAAEAKRLNDKYTCEFAKETFARLHPKLVKAGYLYVHNNKHSGDQKAELKFKTINTYNSNSELNNCVYRLYGKITATFQKVEDLDDNTKITHVANIVMEVPVNTEEIRILQTEINEFLKTLPEKLSRPAMVRQLKSEFTRKAVSENKSLQKFLTTKFLK
jgi:hypothetical protein